MRRHRGRRRTWCALLAAALAVVVLPAPAGATIKPKPPVLPLFGPVRIVAGTGSTGSSLGTTYSAVANCPVRTKVLGGGFTAPFGAGAGLVVYESYRSGPTSWTVSAVNAGGSGAVTAYAYCRRTRLKVTSISASTSVGAGFAANASLPLTCPAGTRVISGGFQTTIGPAPSQFLNTVESTGALKQWATAAVNYRSGPETLTASAYCMKGIHPRPQFRQDQTSLSVPPFGSVSVSSACAPAPFVQGKRAHQALSAGGFYSPFRLDGTVIPVITESRRSGKRWVQTAVNGGNAPGSLTVQSQSMCF